MIRRISKTIHRNLLTVNIVSSGCCMLLGELFAQKITNYSSESKSFDFRKMKESTVVGLSQGSLHHYIHLWIERLIPGTGGQIIFKKIIVDQLIVAPILISHFIYTANFLSGKNMKEIHQIFRDKFPEIYLVDWIVCPFAQYINFRYMPLNYRVLYVNFISLFYSTFLCYIKNKPWNRTLITCWWFIQKTFNFTVKHLLD